MYNIEKNYEFNLTHKKAVLKSDGKVKIVLKIYRNLHKEMDELRESRIEVEVHQEKVNFINDAYEKELRYWKRAALESVSTET